MEVHSSRIVRLEDFGLSSERGFLPTHDPLLYSTKFPFLQEIGLQIPKLLVARQVTQAIKNFAWNVSESSEHIIEADYQYAARVLSFLGHAYVWEDPQNPKSIIPANLAIPWHQILAKLGRPPVLSYASYALYNWQRLNPQQAIELGNIALAQNFLGGLDEEWFILIHVAIEAKSGCLLAALLQAQQAALNHDPQMVSQYLQQTTAVLETICQILLRMPEYCDPYIYYRRVRPYIHGWKDNPALPEGVIYEGVEAYGGEPQQFRGETGAQSCIIPCLDIALGIVHSEDPLMRYLNEMRSYIPNNHRAFLNALEHVTTQNNHVLLWDFVMKQKQSEPLLWDTYRNLVNLVAKFRSIHMDYAKQYIQKQAKAGVVNATEIGTGGTPFIRYLGKHLNETKKTVL